MSERRRDLERENLSSVPASTGIIALALGVVLAPLVLRLAHRYAVLDIPSHRSSHRAPTPRGGGCAIAVAATAAIAFAGLPPRAAVVVMGVPAACALVGLVDDVASLTARTRLVGQLAIGGAMGVVVTDSSTPPAVRLAAIAAVAVWLASCVNAVNFMDGVDGLATLSAVVSGATWFVVGLLEDVRELSAIGGVLGLASLGFLRLNFPTARIFLGDVGSYFLGAWSGCAVIIGLHERVHPVALVAPLSIVLADVARTLLVRVVRRERLASAHRDHVYQQLVDAGVRVPLVSSGVAALAGVCGALGLLSLEGGPGALVAVAGAGAVTSAYLAAPGAVRRR